MSDVKVTAHDEGEQGLILNYYQDVEPVLEIAARERRQEAENTTIRQEFRRKMVIPHVVLMQIAAETGLDFLKPEDSKAIMKILKSPKYAKFRTVNDKRL
jgi:hypothetical protein